MSGGTSYTHDSSTAARPSYGDFLGFDHVQFICGNAKCVAQLKLHADCRHLW